MMKTPDEIKKGLECCMGEFACSECPYCNDGCSDDEEVKDALAYIQQLEDQLREATKKIQQLERERDAAVETLKEIGDCKYCAHDSFCTDRFPNCVDCEKLDCACHTCAYRSNWQWRGAQEVEK